MSASGASRRTGTGDVLDAARSGRRSRPRHRAGSGTLRHALDSGLAWPAAAVVLVALAGLSALHARPRRGEGTLSAAAFLLTETRTEAPGSPVSPDGAGALHVAVHTLLTRAFDRYDELILVGREPVLLATVVAALLVASGARRAGLSAPAAAVAVLLGVLVPLLGPTALVDVPAALAVPWLLAAGWLLAPGRSTRTARLLAALGVAMAAVMAPGALLLVLAAATVAIARGRVGRRLLPQARWGVAGLGAVACGAVAALLDRWAGNAADAPGVSGAAGWATTAAIVLIGALGARWVAALRDAGAALAATGLLVALTTGATSAGRIGTLLVCLPVAGIVAAGLLDTVTRAVPALGRARAAPAARIAAAAVLVSAVIAAAVSAVTGVRSSAGTPAAGARTALLAWTARELPEDIRMAAPDQLWAELLHAGGDEDRIVLPDAGRSDLELTTGAAPPDARVVARFERPSAPPLLVVDPSPAAPTPEELDRRRALAEALLANPTTTTGPGAEAVLRRADVDQRLLSVLAALGGRYGVGIRSFPAADGKPAPGPLARRVVLDRIDGERVGAGQPGTELLTTYLRAQLPPFRPDTVEVTPEGVLVGYRYVSSPDALVSRSAP